ncbi:hypothetical protein C8R44DRAFT_742716 [Mycena epipterygia]|nr:hypothetical protein C8R44DRAFT_742716 [Mycena epipterygia]
MSFSPIISSTGSIESAAPTINLKESTHRIFSDIQDSLRNTVPTEALIGIVIGICSMVSLAVFLLWLKRRRRQEPQEAYADVVTAPYPILFADIAAAIPSASNSADNSDARSITKVRQQYLRNELLAAQEKIIHIQNLEGLRGASDTGSGSRDPEMVIREMAARIRELEAELESPWARGLSDEPPPGYSEEEP